MANGKKISAGTAEPACPRTRSSRLTADRERDSAGHPVVEAESFRWQQRLVRAGDVVQQEQAPAGERVTD